MVALGNEYYNLLVNYAAAVVYEVRPGTSPSDPMIRMLFKNGTDDTFNTFNMFGQSGDIPLSLFTSKLQVCIAFSANILNNILTSWVTGCCY